MTPSNKKEWSLEEELRSLALKQVDSHERKVGQVASAYNMEIGLKGFGGGTLLFTCRSEKTIRMAYAILKVIGEHS